LSCRIGGREGGLPQGSCCGAQVTLEDGAVTSKGRKSCAKVFLKENVLVGTDEEVPMEIVFVTALPVFAVVIQVVVMVTSEETIDIESIVMVTVGVIEMEVVVMT